jgi:hypothetical protein
VNYEANTIKWKPGDLVLHDADDKREDMLMVVLGYRCGGDICETVYLRPASRDSVTRRQVWSNEIRHLHDPKRFGITPQQEPL